VLCIIISVVVDFLNIPNCKQLGVLEMDKSRKLIWLLISSPMMNCIL
jgi:hypothetical protein